MKKALSLALAAMMLLSLAAVALADNSPLQEEETDSAAIGNIAEDTIWIYDKNSKWFGYDWMEANEGIGFVTFNETYYFDVLGNDNYYISPAWLQLKSTAGVKLTAKWDEGGDYVDSVSFERVDDMWCIKLVTKGHSVEPVDVAGKIYLKGTTGSGDNKEKLDGYFTVDLTLEYPSVPVSEGVDEAPVFELPRGWNFIYDFDDVSEEEFTLYFGEMSFGGNSSSSGASSAIQTYSANDFGMKNVAAEVVTDVTNTKKVVLGYTNDDIAAVVDAYPNADLDFVNMTGRFKKTADVIVYADLGSYLYKYENGALTKVDAEYDEWEEGFVFTTKTLGSYVISNVELDLAAVSEVPSVEETANPSTGAAL